MGDTVINTSFHRERKTCVAVLITETCCTVDVSPYRVSACELHDPTACRTFCGPCCPHTFHTPTTFGVTPLHASSRHWCLIDTSLFIVTFPLCQLAQSSMSLCIYWLPAALISVIRVYALIGVNTRMGVAGEHFHTAAINWERRSAEGTARPPGDQHVCHRDHLHLHIRRTAGKIFRQLHMLLHGLAFKESLTFKYSVNLIVKTREC